MGLGVAGSVAVGAAAAGAVGSVGSSIIQGNAAKSAANTEANAQQQAAALQQQQQAQTRADLLPYNQAGQNNLGIYGNFYQTTADQAGQAFNLAQDHIPQPMTEANLINTPGYQFNLSQGMRAIDNSAAARGLGLGGAGIQAAARYATGLADNTYQNQFNNQQSIYNDYVNQANTKLNQLNSIYAQIGAPVTTGENAAAQTGSIGFQNINAAGNDIAQAGNARAAGITGPAANTGNALQTVGNTGLNALGIQQALNNSNLFGNNGGSDLSGDTQNLLNGFREGTV